MPNKPSTLDKILDSIKNAVRKERADTRVATKKKEQAAKEDAKAPANVATKKETTKKITRTVAKPKKGAAKKKTAKPEGYAPKKTLTSLAIKDFRTQEWLAERSKIKAAIENGLPSSYLNVRRMLYLGAAHGYTVAHIQDKPVELYAVEKSREMMQYFLPLVEDLPTVVPIYGDAASPDSYANHIPDQMDLIFQDIAQRDQVGIFLSNCNRFLSPQGVGILSLKAKNVNSTAEPAAIFAEARQKLEREGATIVQEINLEPYHKYHRVYVIHLNPLLDW